MQRTIDASVVGEVMFPDKFRQVARGILFRGDAMIAPDVLDAEMLSIATKRVRTGRASVDDARKRWRLATAIPIDRVPVRSYAEAAFELSCMLPHPSADCLYLAVAIAESAPLVTADRRLYDSAIQAGLAEHVVWLEDAS